MKAGLAAWALALASVLLLVASLRGDAQALGTGLGLGWSWFILSLLAAGFAAILLVSEPPDAAGSGTP